MNESLERQRPRFHPSIKVPDVIPQGMELHKFHGIPVFLTAAKQDEPRFANSNFTEKQAHELLAFESARLRAIETGVNFNRVISEMQSMTVGLATMDSNTDALRAALIERPRPNAYKDGILLTPGIETEIDLTVSA